MADNNAVVEMCRKAVADIIASVGGVGNLLQDENRMALIQSIADRLKLLGADVDAILGPQLAQAYFQGMTDADAFLSQQGKDVSVTGVDRQVHMAGVESIVADTMQDMNASFRTATLMAIADIDGIMASVNEDIAKGMILGDPTDVVARRVEQTFAKNGMTSFVTSDGKRLPLDFYAQTVTRTKTRVAHTTGAVNRYKESGVYHVKINEHHPTCGVCARYQGMVVALDEDHAEGFPTDIPLPPYHPNCQHVARPYVMEFHSETDIKNEKRKWNQFDPDDDPRTDAQKNLYKAEQDIRRKARKEMKEYEILKATAKPGDKIPKTLGAYRRIKRKGDEEWKALQATYKQNAGDVESAGPRDPGTPRKKKGSAKGTNTPPPPPPKAKKSTPKKKSTSSSTTTPKKSAPKKSTSTGQAKPKKTAPKKAPSARSMSTASGMKLDNVDMMSVNKFDNAIDGIEFTDRKKAVQHLLKSVPGGYLMNVKIAKINANGYVSSYNTGGKIDIREFALMSQENRPPQYHWKTMFHEFYHANFNRLPQPPGGMNKAWTKWEETATECSAFFMSDRAGIDVSTISPSYSEYLIETLPRLKQLDEFKDCVDMRDFGAKFMKYRFDPKHQTADWDPLMTKIVSGTKQHNKNKYFADNYADHMKQNIEKYTEMIFDSLQQDKSSYGDSIKNSIRSGLKNGILNGKVTREVQMALPIAMNEIGVK